jgi:UDP-N-acetylglucosamine transferase subunit ALG13
MIFVTVGEQLPFDRLITAVDIWAADSGEEVFAQIGNSQLKPKNIQYKKHVDPIEFKHVFLEADFIIAHAGMGTIITALELRKPLLVMPRQASFGEHRNDHQLATAKRFLEQGYISVADDVPELMKKLEDLRNSKNFNATTQNVRISNKLIEVIRDFVFDR